MDDVDEEAIERLRILRDQVARPGEDVLGELLRLFTEDSDLRVKALAREQKHGNSEEVRRAAHALKGSAANLGAKRVADLAYEMERAPMAVSEAQVEALAAAVERAVILLREKLR